MRGKNNIIYPSGTGMDTSDATATASHILSPYTAYGKNGLMTGTIESKEAENYTPSNTNQIISAGKYLSGDQTILGDNNFVESNIKSGVTIWGKTGTYSGGISKVIYTNFEFPSGYSSQTKTFSLPSGIDPNSSIAIACTGFYGANLYNVTGINPGMGNLSNGYISMVGVIQGRTETITCGFELVYEGNEKKIRVTYNGGYYMITNIFGYLFNANF